MEVLDVSLEPNWSAGDIQQNFSAAELNVHTEKGYLSSRHGVESVAASRFDGRRMLHWELFRDTLCLREIWLDSELSDACVLLRVDGTDVEGINMNFSTPISGTLLFHLSVYTSDGNIFLLTLESRDVGKSFLVPLVKLNQGEVVNFSELVSFKDEGIRSARILGIKEPLNARCCAWLSHNVLLLGLKADKILICEIQDSNCLQTLVPDESVFQKIWTGLIGEFQKEFDTIMVCGLNPLGFTLNSVGSLRIWNIKNKCCIYQGDLASLIQESFDGLRKVYSHVVMIDEENKVLRLAISCECILEFGSKIVNSVIEFNYTPGKALVSKVFILKETHERFPEKYAVDMDFDSQGVTLTGVFRTTGSSGEVVCRYNLSENTPHNDNVATCAPTELYNSSFATILASRGNGLLTLDELEQYGSVAQAVRSQTIAFLRRLSLEELYAKVVIAAVITHDVPYSLQKPLKSYALEELLELAVTICQQWANSLIDSNVPVGGGGRPSQDDPIYLEYIGTTFRQFLELCDTRMSTYWSIARCVCSPIDVIQQRTYDIVIAKRDSLGMCFSSPSIRGRKKNPFHDILELIAANDSPLSDNTLSLFYNQLPESPIEYVKWVAEDVLSVPVEKINLSQVESLLGSAIPSFGNDLNSAASSLVNENMWGSKTDWTEIFSGNSSSSKIGPMGPTNSSYFESLAKIIIQRKFTQIKHVCILLVLVRKILLSRFATVDIIDECIIKTVYSFSYIVHLCWVSESHISRCNKLSDFISPGDAQSKTCQLLKIGADKFGCGLSPEQASIVVPLWHNIWSVLGRKVSSFWIPHFKKNVPDFIECAIIAVSECLRPSLYSDIYSFLKSTEITYAEKYSGLMDHSKGYDGAASLYHGSGDRLFYFQICAHDHALDTLKSLMLGVGGGYLEKEIAGDKLDKCLELFYESYSDKSSSDSNCHDPLIIEKNTENWSFDFEYFVQLQIVELIDADELVSKMEQLEKIITAPEFAMVMGAFNVQESNFIHFLEKQPLLVSLFSKLYHYSEVVELLQTGHGLLPAPSASQHALQVSYLCANIISELLTLLDGEIRILLEVRLLRMWGYASQFALEASQFDESLEAIDTMIYLSNRVDEERISIRWRDSLRSLIARVCSEGNFGWLCSLDEKRFSHSNLPHEISKEMEELAVTSDIVRGVPGPKFNGDLCYYEMLVVYLLYRSEFASAARVANSFLSRFLKVEPANSGIITPRYVCNISFIIPPFTSILTPMYINRWYIIIIHCLSLLAQDEAFVDHRLSASKCLIGDIRSVWHQQISPLDTTLSHFRVKFWNMPAIDSFERVNDASQMRDPLRCDIELPFTHVNGYCAKSIPNCIHAFVEVLVNRSGIETFGSHWDKAQIAQNCPLGHCARPLNSRNSLAPWLPVVSVIVSLDSKGWDYHLSCIHCFMSLFPGVQIPKILLNSFFSEDFVSSEARAPSNNVDILIWALIERGYLVDAFEVVLHILQCSRYSDKLLIPSTTIDTLVEMSDVLIGKYHQPFLGLDSDTLNEATIDSFFKETELPQIVKDLMKVRLKLSKALEIYFTFLRYKEIGLN
jgi:hypothetical protein